MAITAALKAIYASAPTTQRFIETLTISHSLFPQVYYITNDNQNWAFLLENGISSWFIATPFQLVLPTQDGKGNQDMGVTIANLTRDLIAPIEAAIAKPTEPITCTYRVYLDTPLSAPQNNPPLTLWITDIQVTRESVSATATRADVLNRSFPFQFYRYEKYPGLRR